MSFKPFGKGNPCKVCGQENSACRQHTTDENFVHCHTHASARKLEVINGWKCIEVAKGHTAGFRPDDTGEKSQEYITRQLQENALQKRKNEAIEKKLREQALPVAERHQFYSEILDQLTIDGATRADLLRRGFSEEEITRSGFKSVKRSQRLNKEFPTTLPGVKGNRLAVSGDGFLCPIRDFDGNITGMQLRLHNPIDGNRYRWLSTPQAATLKLQPENENPLAVFHPPSGKPEAIAIVEGTGAKPFFVSQRLNYLTIGAAGGNWLGSKQLLVKYIKQAFEQYGELPLIVIPDADFALNPLVKSNIANTFKWLEEKYKDSQIKVLDWNQIHKSQGDIDEIDDLSIVRCLSLESFRDKKYKEVFAGKNGFNRFNTWAEDRVKLTADITQHEKWLNIPQGIQDDCDILLIRKALGGGKTQALIDFLKPLDTTSLLVGYRNTLLFNTIDRANNMGLSAQHIKDAVQEVSGGRYFNFAGDDSIKLWGGCADSFYKFNAIKSHNSDYFLIHDEICSVLNHLKGGGTLKGRQQAAIDWDVETINNSQFSIMMDANLSDREVDFIRALFPEKRIKVLDSCYPTNPRDFYFLETATDQDFSRNPKYLPVQLVDKSKQHNKVLWISDSQRSCEVIDEILSKHGHKHFRLDGKTSHDEISKQFQSNPKQFITTGSLDSLSISPSGESGLSIDLFGYFDAVCFDIRGTVGVNTLTQLSARLRDTDVPIYVSCPEYINITSDPCPYALKKVREVMEQRIELLAAKVFATDSELLDSQYVADMFTEMGQKFSSDPWFVESLKDAKDLKYEHSNLKLCLKTALVQAGHRVTDLTQGVNPNTEDEVAETKEMVKHREAEKVFNSEDIDWEKAQELSKLDLNFDDKCKIRKARIKHDLPDIEQTPSWTTDFVRAVDIDDSKFIGRQWRMKRLQTSDLFTSDFKKQQAYNLEHDYQWKDAWNNDSIRIEALKLMGIEKLIDQKIFSSKDQLVKQIVDSYYDEPEWFNLIGISKVKRPLKPDGTPKNTRYVKDMINRLLDFFGLEAKEIDRKNKTRIFSIGTPKRFDPFIADIDACLERRAKQVIKEAENISLKEAAHKAEEANRQSKEWEDQQAKLNKRLLENQLSDSDKLNIPQTKKVTSLRDIYINQKEDLSPISDSDKLNIP
ncbi:MAG: hypothetical protein HC874_25000, partial [Richelia sp. SL_2_1]|nr:hypothetical protein [Richelia sp. SL_2_1]